MNKGVHGRTLVTATHAVFIEHKGHRAPVAVVGLQFQHSALASHFINITSAVRKFSVLRFNFFKVLIL